MKFKKDTYYRPSLGEKMTERLTAEKARDLARAKDHSFAVDEILRGIEKKALDRKYEYVTRGFGFGSGECYSSEEKWPALCQEIVKELRSLGYKAQVRSSVGQFVDLWLEVTWGE